jgi:hypothetical protein
VLGHGLTTLTAHRRSRQGALGSTPVIRRTLRGGLWLGLLVGLVLLVAKLVRTRSSAPATIDLRTPGDSPAPESEAWAPLQTPAPVETEPVPKNTLPPWVAPEDGICPATHPVKAKLSSGIFQVEGNAMYARTRPDRCYQTPETAAEDGLRPAKR